MLTACQKLGDFQIKRGNGRGCINGFEEGTANRLIRRSGQVVPWNDSKIEVAVRKAFLSLQLDSEPAVDLARQVTRKALSTGQAFINIEGVQDLVQEELMRKGHFKVAESYILYRAAVASKGKREPPETKSSRTR